MQGRPSIPKATKKTTCGFYTQNRIRFLWLLGKATTPKDVAFNPLFVAFNPLFVAFNPLFVAFNPLFVAFQIEKIKKKINKNININQKLENDIK